MGCASLYWLEITHKTKGTANLTLADLTARPRLNNHLNRSINSGICPNQLSLQCMKPRTKNRSRESERLKRKQLLPLTHRYSERRKRVYVAAAIKIPAASNRTRHLWPPSCLLLRASACEKTWVKEKPSTNQTNQTKVSFVYGTCSCTFRANMNTPIGETSHCSSRKPMRRHFVSGFPRALLSLAHAQMKRD